MRHCCQHRENADAVGDEVGRVLGADDALAQRRRQEGLELIEEQRLGGVLRDQLDQMHVARGIEKMDTAEPRPQVSRAGLRQRVDRQAGGVAREDRLRADMRRDLLVKRLFPIHALGYRLDHEVASGEQREMLVVVCRRDAGGAVLCRQRRGLELLQVLDRFLRDAVRIALLGRKIEQQRRNAGVGEVRGDLRAHDARTEDGGLANEDARLRHVQGLHSTSSKSAAPQGATLRRGHQLWTCYRDYLAV